MQKAQRATVFYGDIELEVFMLPDGSYTFSMTQIGQTVGKTHKSIGHFISSQSPEALSVKGFTVGQMDISPEIEGNPPLRITAIPLKVAVAYWTYWARQGNEKAQALLMAGTEEVLTRKCDAAFGVEQTEEEYNNALASNVSSNALLAKLVNVLEENNRLVAELNNTKTSKLALENEQLKLNLASAEVPGARAVLDEASCDTTDEDQYISVEQYLASIGLNIPERVIAIKRRVAQFYRAAKQKNPTVIRGRNVYHINEIEFIKQAVKAEFNL